MKIKILRIPPVIMIFLCWFLTTENSYAQERLVTGTVTSSDGEVLVGVNVILKGTSTGTVTDVNGNYNLTLPTDGGTLVFSFIGFTSEEVAIGSRTTVNVSLEEDVQALNEVVVIGYGTVKKSDLTGAVASVKPDDLNQGAIVSIDQALQGRVAGVRINQASAEPGGGINIRIRGAGSISAGNQPLYVVDGLPINGENMLSGGGGADIPNNGVPKNPLNSINPNDIASIEILKDASATAIYGSRGANGVILITTKSGGAGKFNVNVDSYVGVQTIYKNPKMLSTSEYIKTMNDLADERGQGPVFTDADIEEIGEGTNWLEHVTRDAKTTSHNISFNGGNSTSKYFVSANYMNQDGVIKNTGTERYSFRINLNHDFSDKLSFGMHLTTSLVNDQNSIEGSGNTENGPYALAAIYDPTMKPYNEDGSIAESDVFTFPSPVATLLKESNTSTSRILGSMNLNYEIIPDLNANAKFGVDRRIGREDLFTPGIATSSGSKVASGRITSLERYSYLLQFTMDYSKSFSDNVDFNILGGSTFERFTNQSFAAGISDFPTDLLGTDNLGLGNIENASIWSNKNENTLLSYLGRTNITLFDKVLFTASIRIDGSSRFGENNKFATFPSAAIAYKLSNEPFIPEILNELKIRTSWGKTGNQSIGNYASLSTFSTGGQALFDDSPYQGTTATRLPNPDLKWETTSQFDIGLDFALWEDRLWGSFDYFVKNTEDMLMNFPLPTSSSFQSVIRNIGSMKNTGVELMINSRNISGNNFKWTSGFQISTIKNEVTDIGGVDDIMAGNFFTTSFAIIRPGEELNAYYTLEQIGIFQTQEEVDNSAQPSSAPGNPIYRDVNKDGQINDADRVVVGSPWPDFTYGLSNEISYKNTTLSFFIDGQQGADLFNANITYSLHPPTERQNRIRELMLDRWTPDNPDAEWPSAVNPSSYGPYKIDSKQIEDASFVRLQSIRLSHSVPLKAKWINRATIYATGQNLLIITNYSGLNPEANRNQDSNAWAERNTYPIAKTYLFGLKLEF
jgi:TonB-linked SusC/RagA family outer membrane protein